MPLSYIFLLFSCYNEYAGLFIGMLRKSYKKVKEFFDKYEKYLGPAFMAVGFMVDNLTLQRIDLWIENLVIISYFVIVIFSILYINLYKKKLFQNKVLVWLNMVLPFVLQFAFGGLFSAFMVFYSRSSSLFVSWPFLLILLGLLVGNELFRERYQRLAFHIGIFYLALFAYLVFAVPILFGRIDIEMFLASGGLSLLFIFVFILFLYRLDDKAVKKSKDKLVWSIVGIYFVFNFLYFANVIPPIPLALKFAGVYHGVNRSGVSYLLEYEQPGWYRFWRETSYIYHHQAGSRVYIFNSIFAPTKFKQQIYHQWFYYDQEKGEWLKKDRLSYSMVGGRDGGYRGYSYKTSVAPGKWKVKIMTDSGQVLGRVKFRVIEWGEGVEILKEFNG